MKEKELQNRGYSSPLCKWLPMEVKMPLLGSPYDKAEAIEDLTEVEW